MFCIKCGAELPDGSKFCRFCGALQTEAAVRNTVIMGESSPIAPEMQVSGERSGERSKTFFIIAGTISLLILAIAVAVFILCGFSKRSSYQEQLNLGQRYLEDGDYEAAILAFSKAIKVDPRQAEAYAERGNTYILRGETDENLSLSQTDYETAIELNGMNPQGYLGLADVLIRRGDYVGAADILEEAQNVTNDEKIADKLKEFENGMVTDAQGKLRRRSRFDENGNLLWYHEYSYDSLGRNCAVTLFDNSGTQQGQVKVLYDENGNCIQDMEGYGNMGKLFTIVYEVDSSGRNAKGTTYNPDGGIEYYIIYEYDGNGRITKESRYYPSDELMDYEVYEYDGQGKLVEIITYDEDGTELRSNKY